MTDLKHNELQQYTCHKTVKAGKIYAITSGFNNYVVTTANGAVRVVSNEWMGRNSAASVGGYFVEYEDGYTSYSPAQAFEAGYTAAEDSK